jgi:tetratricopeptide (TPR) repeat protein
MVSRPGRNDPCPCGSGKKYKHCCLGSDSDPFRDDTVVSVQPALMDRRAIERHLTLIRRIADERLFETDEEFDAYLAEASVTQNWPAFEPRTPLERAQQLMFDAFAATGSRRVRLARQALETSRDCADAYVLLAEETARSAREALPLYEKALAAGERALGAEAMAEYLEADLFWRAIDTRPYMRARFGLAEALAALGRKTEAIEHYRGLLDLNPGDNQGARYRLLLNLLETKRDDEARALVPCYPDEISAVWLYGRALLKFRRDGNSLFAARSLAAAVVANSWVPIYLLGDTPFPKRFPDYTGIGDETEAIWCAAEIAKAWMETPGANAWLAKIYDGGPRTLPKPESGSGPDFFLNRHDDWGLTRCPNCDQPTKIRKRHLAVSIEPDQLLPIHLTCRMCDACNILFIHERDAQPAIMAEATARGLELIDQDFILLGVVDRAALGGRQPDDDDERSRILAHLQRFHEERVFAYSPLGWYLPDTFALDEAIGGPVAVVDAASSLVLPGPG